ncbi:MAG: hypothetical protein HGA85_07905 [Nanoarchaeota archaeon]|nr:hypothetical protein [Nanoarchaeota archaeon]
MSQFPKCTGNFQIFRDSGYDIHTDTLRVNVTINEETIVVGLFYPSVFKLNGKSYVFDRRMYTLDRSVTSKLNNEDGTTIISEDGSMILNIPPNTEARLGRNTIDTVGIKLLDRNFDDHSNRVLAGMLAFEGLPKGAVFSKPVEIVYYYDDMMMPYSINENELTLGYYDDRGLWIGLPGEIDTEKNKITIYTTHFTPFGSVIGCKPAESKKSVIVTQTLIQQKCNPCDGWFTQSPSPQLFQAAGKISVDEGIGEVTQCVEREIELDSESLCDSLDGDWICDECQGTIIECLNYEPTNCVCKAKVQSYETPESLYGSNEYSITFIGDGDSCVSGNPTTDAPSVYYQGSSNADLAGADIQISPYFCSVGDECKIESGSGWGKDGNDCTFTFKINAVNQKAFVDACLKTQAMIVLNGVNIEQMYLTCSDSQVGTSDFVGMGVCSTCTKDGNVNKWVATDYANCNSDTACAGSLEGKTRLDISKWNLLDPKSCEACSGGSWVETDISFCNRCINEGDAGPVCYEYDEESDYRARELMDYANYLHSLNIPAAEFTTQMLQFSLTQDSSEEEKLRELLEVLTYTTRDEGIYTDAIWKSLKPLGTLLKVGNLDSLNYAFGEEFGNEYFFAAVGIASPADVNPMFSDGSDGQVRHIYYYLAFAYDSPKIAELGNYLHENAPGQGGESQEDYNAGLMGIALGNALRDHISLEESISTLGFDELKTMINTEKSLYNEPVSLDNLAQVVNYGLSTP